MREVVIQIPTLEAEQNIEIDVRINGRKRTIKYRVEIVDWEENPQPPEEKIEVLRHIIKEHEKGWELIQIGAPTKGNVPIMFRQRAEQPVQE
ncbi:MAG: hypothetical protein PHU88_00920 [candidate division Zixibacteria bacterium]|nr:hypothetical protein [candidate division Zixibacteria bacterium]MDD5425550.1 hypothetical protein [candidate division Zixibacteria bacterium]